MQSQAESNYLVCSNGSRPPRFRLGGCFLLPWAWHIKSEGWSQLEAEGQLFYCYGICPSSAPQLCYRWPPLSVTRNWGEQKGFYWCHEKKAVGSTNRTRKGMALRAGAGYTSQPALLLLPKSNPRADAVPGSEMPISHRIHSPVPETTSWHGSLLSPLGTKSPFLVNIQQAGLSSACHCCSLIRDWQADQHSGLHKDQRKQEKCCPFQQAHFWYLLLLGERKKKRRIWKEGCVSVPDAIFPQEGFSSGCPPFENTTLVECISFFHVILGFNNVILGWGPQLCIT